VTDALAFGERIAALSARVLGDVVRSVILHGSLALDDYAPGQSDIDLLVIVDRPLDRAQIDALIDGLTAARSAAPARVDLRVVTAGVAATPPRAPPMELYVALDPMAEPDIVSHHPGQPDLVVELSLCRERGRALRGAAPSELIGEVPDRWVLCVGDAQLARWQALTDDARHAMLMVLTACRTWRFAVTGSHCSKSAAGAWALTRDPSLQAVRAALRQRAGDPAHIEPADIGRLLTIARARITASQLG
jgi:nucleotidyltransferase-like protein/aminoglycoside adenylyltransferase-like protein